MAKRRDFKDMTEAERDFYKRVDNAKLALDMAISAYDEDGRKLLEAIAEELYRNDVCARRIPYADLDDEPIFTRGERGAPSKLTWRMSASRIMGIVGEHSVAKMNKLMNPAPNVLAYPSADKERLN